MQWGAAHKYWQKRIDAGQQNLPQQYHDIPEQPELSEHLLSIWNEFHELTTERSIGFGEGPIPASRIRQRAIAIGFDDEEDAERFYKLIRQIDDAYLLDRTKPKTEKIVTPDDEAGTARLFRNIASAKKLNPRRKKP